MTKVYRYYNRNPNKTIKQDCVCRAISTATGLKYHAVDNLLTLASKLNKCEKLCVCCYDKLLEDILEYKGFNCINGETVEQIASKFVNKTLLIRISEHLTVSVKGTVLDIWDCTQELVDCFWIIE